MSLDIVVATGNPHKTVEIRDLLHEMESIRVLDPSAMPDVEESAGTFSGNALLKAQALRSSSDSVAILSDDSGLSVESLRGAPGVYSSRYAGVNATDEDNIQKLLHNLNSRADDERVAAFICVICLLLPGAKEPHFFEGRIEGHIARRPRGSSGFGYDPVFIPSGYRQTFAELGNPVKNQLSHRARALQQLKNFFFKGGIDALHS